MPKPIRKILIANRGEIALRIIRAAKELNIEVAGIYSENDRNSPWIAQCNEAWSLGEGKLSQTYLNISKITSIALKCGADAIHPGYGFLSENPLLAATCFKNDLIFIGPSAEVLQITGNKTASHEIARSLGIPVPEKISGTVAQLLDRSATINYPVMVKAAAGGGGKGMRLVRESHEIAEALRNTSGEALQYFGNDTLFLERYIHPSRHIEIQILADQHGNRVHLYDRECSLQRRHQKVVEEAPAMIIPQDTRLSLIDAALRISEAVHYTHAGTVEFLVDDKWNFHFLEINPRIQVEHGITEMITGIDIVKEQISISEGNPLSFSQKDVEISGHAIQARIYAEDPENDLLPSPGNIFIIDIPEMPGVRIETGVTNGMAILTDYDPLIAKIMVHEQSRDAAISLMNQVIEKFSLTGIRHNLPLLDAVFSDRDFLANNITTTFIDQKLPSFSAVFANAKRNADPVKIAIAGAIHFLNVPAASKISSPWLCGYWRNVKQIRFRYNQSIIELEYEFEAHNAITFYHHDQSYTTAIRSSDDNMLVFSLNDTLYKYYMVPNGPGKIEIHDGHAGYILERFMIREQEFDIEENTAGDPLRNTVIAPQPGTILDIKVSVGQQVNRGDYLITIESMKLENTIMAAQQGFVKEIIIKTGDRVSKNDPLIYLQQTINN